VTTLTLHATGPVDPAEVWERYAVPARWPSWAPHITGVELAVPRLAAGAAGRVHGPGGLALPFEVEAVDEAARRWSWRVHAGPVTLHLVHWVTAAPDGGTTTGLRTSGPAPVVLGYAPLATWALRRLVRLAPS
jgi:hypothetical protein